MKVADVYVDLDGHETALAALDAQERRLVARLRRRARTHPDWTDFDNCWTRELLAFYTARGVRRSAVPRTVPWKIAQDLSARLGIAAGLVAPDDCAGDLEEVIRAQFGSREAFCKATRLSEQTIRDFLAGRGDLSVAALQQGLERIGYSVRIRPAPVVQPKGSAKSRVG